MNKGKSKKCHDFSSAEDSSDHEVVVEERKRYEPMDYHLLPPGYETAMQDIFKVQASKISDWCGNGFI